MISSLYTCKCVGLDLYWVGEVQVKKIENHICIISSYENEAVRQIEDRVHYLKFSWNRDFTPHSPLSLSLMYENTSP